MLKQILLRKKIEGLRAQMTQAEQTRDQLMERRAAMKLREEQLEQAVGEVDADTTDEAKDALDEETAKWEADDAALTQEENDNAETTRRLQEQIDELQRELNELDNRSAEAAKTQNREERKDDTIMNTRKFFGMNMQERDAFFARQDVKDFLVRVRELGGQKRAITGSELLEVLEASTFCTPEAIGGFPQVSGIEFTVDTTKAYDADAEYPGTTYFAPKSINRVTIQSVGGKDFDPAATYTIATNDFMASGGDTYYRFVNATANYDLGIAMDEVVMQYITEVLGGTVTADKYGEATGRITVVS